MSVVIDTNIALRFLLSDDPIQSPKACKLIDNNRILLLTTVVMEIEWVLRSAYKFGRPDIQNSFAELFGMKQVRLEQPELIAIALHGYDEGMDFADALHMAAAIRAKAKAFATFDRALVKNAAPFAKSIDIFEP